MKIPALALLLLTLPVVSDGATLLHVDCSPQRGPTVAFGIGDQAGSELLDQPALTEGRNAFGAGMISLRIDSDEPELVKLYWNGYKPGADDDVKAGRRAYVALLNLSDDRLTVIAPARRGDHWMITVYPKLDRALFTLQGRDVFADMYGWMFPANCRVVAWPDS